MSNNFIVKRLDNMQSADRFELIGKMLIQQALKNAELEQQLNIIGQSIVQLMLKGGIN
jgi:hypothetical protein